MAKTAEKTEIELVELAPYWDANPEANTLLQVGTQIFLNDKKGTEDAQAYAYRSNLDILEVKRPK